MKFARGHKKVGGRQIGTPNKLSPSAKEAFQHAFEANGGVERLVEWIKEDPDNERVFYQIYSKLFPVDVNPAVRGDVTFTWKRPQGPAWFNGSKDADAIETRAADTP
jgi:hypothetical protein